MAVDADVQSATSLIEREAELAALEGAVTAARAGEAAVLAVEGAAGIGKSSLLDAVAAASREAGFAVFRGRGVEVERGIAFGLAGQLLTPALVARPTRERARLMRGAAAGAASVLLSGEASASHGGATVLPSADRLHAALHGLFWLVVNLAERERALALVADDLHWADEPSIRFLLFLAQRCEGLPLVLACGARTGEPDHPAALAELLALATPRLRPAALSRDGAGRIVARHLGRDGDARFVEACHRATGGNPFLCEELARALAGAGVDPTARAAADVTRATAETVRDWVRARVERQGAEASAVAHAVAVLGERSELVPVAELAGVTREQAARAAARLADAEILRSGSPLSFVHPLVATAVYEALSPLERALTHERAAKLLAARGAGPERVAGHLMLTEPAGNADVAAALLRAARAALGRGAPEASLRYIERARREAPPAGLAAELARVAIQAEVRIPGKRLGRPLQEWLSVLDEHPELLVDTAYEVAMLLIATGRHRDAVELLTRAADAARDADSETRLRVEAQTITVATYAVGTASLITERLAAARCDWPPRDAGERAVAAMDVWWTSLGTGTARDVGDAAEQLLEAGLLAEQGSSSSVFYQLFWSLVVAERFDAAERHITAALEHARAAGSLTGFTLASMFRAFLATRRGDAALAEADARTAFEITSAEVWIAMPFGLVALFGALVERDPAGMSALVESLNLSGELPESLIWHSVLFERGRLRLWQGRAHDGIEDLLEAGRRRGDWGFVNPGAVPWASHAGPALAHAGRRDEALAIVEEELARAEHWGAPGMVGIALRARGLVLGGEAGVAELERAVALLERSGRSLALARTLVEQGALLRRLRRRVEAREPLRRGLELARRHGGTVVAERARHELAATGEKMSRAGATAGEPLTPSEHRIAALAAAGMKNREIAESQFLTVKTVEMHLRNAYRKLGIASRAELAHALEQGQAQGLTL